MATRYKAHTWIILGVLYAVHAVERHSIKKEVVLMNTDIVVGKAKQRKGKLKEEAGKVTGDTDMEITGLAEQATGKIQEVYGKLKENIEKEIGD